MGSISELDFSAEHFDNHPGRKLPSRPADTGSPAICLPQPVMCMTQSCYWQIMEELTRREPEAGGLLLGPIDDELITHYIPDENAIATGASFTLDAPGLNRILRKFRECGMNGKGLVHSHPRGCTQPSGGDLAYVRKSLANEKNQTALKFMLPIVCGQRLYPYLIQRDQTPEVVLAQLLLV